MRLPERPSIAPGSALTGRVSPDATVALAIALPLRNEDQLQALLARLYDRADPLYGHYLTPQEFASQFAPTQEDYDAVASFARSQGLNVSLQPNRLVLDISGPAGAVESAFQVHLRSFAAPDGRAFFAADDAPALPFSIASRVSAVVGLDSAASAEPNVAVANPGSYAALARGNGTGSGVSGGLTPGEIKQAYSSAAVPEDGTGQSIAVFELDDYTDNEVGRYEAHYFPRDRRLAPLARVLVDGGPGAPSGSEGELEAALDIELNLAVAPHAAHIYVYEAPNTLPSMVDEYNQIALDDKASVVSTSWGVWEDEFGGSKSVQTAENAIFQEMAAQGQSVFSAVGDCGAYDPHTGSVAAQDPATQPYVCGVGGTTLSLKPNGSYAGETCWWTGPSGTQYASGQGTGGGVSAVWPIPSYQSSYYSAYFQNVGQYLSTPAYADMASIASRNTPDVSLDADPATGYDIYTDAYGDGWISAGGTSAAAQVWGAFAALVNQARAASSAGPLGFPNPLLYSLASTAGTNSALHDVTSGLDGNGYWSTGIGYDDTTGLGSFDMAALLAELVPAPPAPAKPVAPAAISATAGDKAATVSCAAGAGATGYRWYVYSPANPSGGILAATTSKPTATIGGLANGAAYEFRVVVFNSAGASGFSPYSNTVTPQPVVIAAGPSTVGGRLKLAVMWSTNLDANTVFRFGSTPALGETISQSQLTQSHTVNISNPPRSGKVYYQIQSSDGITTAVTSGSFSP